MAIWKLMHHPMFWDFAGGVYPVKWVALNIPMNAFGKMGFEGDIDMLFSLSKPPVLEDWPPDYVRAFEVKTATIDGEGNIKSWDNEKFEYGIKQCQKLEQFGAEMIFLIDLFILEQGKSLSPETWYKVEAKVRERTKIMEATNFGYNVKYVQYMADRDEYDAGILHFPRDYVLGKGLPIKEPFKKLTTELAKIAEPTMGKGWGVSILFFCKNCKQIAATYSQERNPQCNHCGHIIRVYD